MWMLVLPLLLQVPQQTPQPASPRTRAQLERLVATQEAVRDSKGGLVSQALASPDPKVQQLALRALGRMQDGTLSSAVLPFMKSPNVDVRAEAANALGQINAAADYESYLRAESNGSVRAVLFESVGRIKTPPANAEAVLAAGLADASPAARVGAAKGLEALVRQRGRNGPPAAPETMGKVHDAFRANTGQTIRQLLLLTMSAAGDRDSSTLALAVRDSSAQVRRLAVMGLRRWVDDPSPLVQYQALRAANNCERAASVLSAGRETATQAGIDVFRSEMVKLAAIDMFGDRKCESRELQRLITGTPHWRELAHALVALAKTAPDSARRYVGLFAFHPLWHTRMYAATAARVLGDSATLFKLARDTQPNVATEAMTTTADAIHALSSNHAGLVMTAANKLKGAPELKQLMPQLKAAFERPGNLQKSSSADARDALAARMREVDPNVQLPAADTRTIPLPAAAAIARNNGATAQITMKGLGVISLELLNDEAPLTVYTFAALADSGKYNGLTFHRVVPNFVIQGGSPGANEYDGVTEPYMRDEVGRVSHLRGTLGISTRGYDKGDGQIFINLVDNFRLDHAYTVFARVTSGMNVVDRVQEGDVMESVKIIRKR